MTARQTEGGIWVPGFAAFEVDNKLRHVEGQYTGICTSCPDGKITRAATKHIAKMAGVPEEEWNKSLYDVLNFTGASKGFIDPLLRESSLYQLEVLVRGHHLSNYFLIDHEKCFAYLDELFKSPLRENEKLFHVHRLQEAYTIITKRLPDLKVTLVYLSCQGEQLRFEEVPPPGAIIGY